MPLYDPVQTALVKALLESGQIMLAACREMLAVTSPVEAMVSVALQHNVSGSAIWQAGIDQAMYHGSKKPI